MMPRFVYLELPICEMVCRFDQQPPREDTTLLLENTVHRIIDMFWFCLNRLTPILRPQTGMSGMNAPFNDSVTQNVGRTRSCLVGSGDKFNI